MNTKERRNIVRYTDNISIILFNHILNHIHILSNRNTGRCLSAGSATISECKSHFYYRTILHKIATISISFNKLFSFYGNTKKYTAVTCKKKVCTICMRRILAVNIPLYIELYCYNLRIFDTVLSLIIVCNLLTH